MHYRAPPLPVDLRYAGHESIHHQALVPHPTTTTTTPEDAVAVPLAPSATSLNVPEHQELLEVDMETHLTKFRQNALNKHNIRLS